MSLIKNQGQTNRVTLLGNTVNHKICTLCTSSASEVTTIWRYRNVIIIIIII